VAIALLGWGSLADLPEAARLAETIAAWWPQILRFLQTITIGRTEASTINAAAYASTAPGNSRRTTSGEQAEPPRIR
jgi:hypothetical protein